MKDCNNSLEQLVKALEVGGLKDNVAFIKGTPLKIDWDLDWGDLTKAFGGMKIYAVDFNSKHIKLKCPKKQKKQGLP